MRNALRSLYDADLPRSAFMPLCACSNTPPFYALSQRRPARTVAPL